MTVASEAPEPAVAPEVSARARLLALYLPQFHPVPENDEWWGPGFTEWTNVARARPRYRGHEQPRIPGELGFYDLRVPETRHAQAALAREHGIEAFCYWHYWFGGRRILERPFAEVLDDAEPDLPFCLGWANQTWSGVWYGETDRILIDQQYPGLDDHRRHFDLLVRAFHDPRYVRVDGRPVFVVFRPDELPDAARVADLWRTLAVDAGLPGIHLVGMEHGEGWRCEAVGFDARIVIRLTEMFTLRVSSPLLRARRFALRSRRYAALDPKVFRKPVHVYPYDRVTPRLVPAVLEPSDYPCVIPNWDNTPRSGSRGSVMADSTPERYAAHLETAVRAVEDRPAEHRLVVIKSWNEWAEGNYLEPDRRWGRAYLEATRDIVRDGRRPRSG